MGAEACPQVILEPQPAGRRGATESPARGYQAQSSSCTTGSRPAGAPWERSRAARPPEATRPALGILRSVVGSPAPRLLRGPAHCPSGSGLPDFCGWSPGVPPLTPPRLSPLCGAVLAGPRAAGTSRVPSLPEGPRAV